MTQETLIHTVEQIAAKGKGILAADESHKTIGKRFDMIQIENTELNRRDYREMLFTAPGLSEHISGVILFEETLTQKSSNGKALGHVLRDQGIVPGIKVDKGLVTLNTEGEQVTQGLDGLAERLVKYKEHDAKFAKWRAVYTISDTLPSREAIHANAHALARYASICQRCGIVPIVEPEVLMDGTHTIARCAEVTEAVLHEVFHELHINHVLLEGMILKPSMVIAGSECKQLANIDQVAEHTIAILKRTVPAAVPTINFLSGGQSTELATQHLNRMNQIDNALPWNLSFSYGRALQAPSLHAWHGKVENIDAAKQLMQQRAKLNGLANLGKYSAEMESS